MRKPTMTAVLNSKKKVVVQTLTLDVVQAEGRRLILDIHDRGVTITEYAGETASVETTLWEDV